MVLVVVTVADVTVATPLMVLDTMEVVCRASAKFYPRRSLETLTVVVQGVIVCVTVLHLTVIEVTIG